VSDRPSAPWTLRCKWCPQAIIVNARGARGEDPGSGVEAAHLMAAHVASAHGRTWAEFLAAADEPGTGAA